MGMIKLTSSNPNMSFIIKKNPSTGMIQKKIRKGLGYGWFSEHNNYNVYFKDFFEMNSYGDGSNSMYEYLNKNQYTSPFFVLNCIQEFFKAPLQEDELDSCDVYTHSFEVLMVTIEKINFLQRVLKHFKSENIIVEYQLVNDKNYSITLSTTKSLHYLFHFAQTMFAFIGLFSKEYMVIDQNVIKKYTKSLNIIDAPYYVRYMFSSLFITDRKVFEEIKSELETSNIIMNFGNTQQQRKDFVFDIVSTNTNILDIGCGEGDYLFNLAKKLPSDMNYYGVEREQSIIDNISEKTIERKINNVFISNIIPNFDEEKSMNIMMIEVMEHMWLIEAENLILEVLNNKKLNFEKFIITTPNKDFNKFYMIEEHEFRHDDHKFEFTKVEFDNWVEEFIKVNIPSNVEIQPIMIGDCVDEIFTTQGIVLIKK